MPHKFLIGEHVFIPAARTEFPDQAPFALVYKKVIGQNDRSITFDDESGPRNVASRLVHKSGLGFLVLRIGDMATERTLLDPLAKSMLQYVRLLLPDNDVHALNVRTLAELVCWWSVNANAISHVILIGHGSENSVMFCAPPTSVTGDSLAAALIEAYPSTPPKVFISLACLTGRAKFAKAFSQTTLCKELLAPFHSVHGASASQYAQSFLAHHLLDGKEFAAAHRRAVDSTIEGTKFRRWKDGIMQTT